MKLHIIVTQDDIDKAGGGAENCPIAQSMRRTYADPRITTVIAGQGWLFYCYEQSRYIQASTPEKAAQFITDYDTRGKKYVQPFEFDAEFGKLTKP